MISDTRNEGKIKVSIRNKTRNDETIFYTETEKYPNSDKRELPWNFIPKSSQIDQVLLKHVL